MRRDSITGRTVGIVIFLIGIGILFLVAWTTYHFFTANQAGLQFTPSPDSKNSATNLLAGSALKMLYQIALLVVLAVTGSLIAARGLNLYFLSTGSRAAGEQVSLSKESTAKESKED